MSYLDFVERLAFYKQIPADELSNHPELRYALSTRDRGRNYVGRIGRLCADPIDSLSILDIGCAYGGITIEASLAGAKACGVEVVPSYADLARHNARNDASVQIFDGDMTVRTTVSQMGDLRFNTFILNHVLEHIYDTVSLLENLNRIATPDAMVIFDVPNGHSMQSFRAEGHTGIFAVSLADPDCWPMFGRPDRARIYYRKLRYFETLFGAFGFKVMIARDPTPPREQLEITLRAAMAEFRNKEDSITREFVTRFCAEAEYDLENASDEALDLTYFHYFWRGVAVRDPQRLSPELRSGLPATVWGAD